VAFASIGSADPSLWGDFLPFVRRFSTGWNPKKTGTFGAHRLKEAEIAGAVGNDTFNLGIVLKLKTERLELASYLKGLQFGASKTGKV
jgi:hypothetical protein